MLHIIANPASQSGSGIRRAQELVKLLQKENIEAVLHTTTHQGHSDVLAGSLNLSPEDRLLLIGGDGSLNGLVNGLKLPCSTPLLLYPAGSGNDFARGMKISHDAEDLIRILKKDAKGKTTLTRTDLGSVTSIGAGPEHAPSLTDYRFAVTCGFGFDAEICHSLEAGNLKAICNHLHLGKLSYILVGIKTIFQTDISKRAHMTVTADGKTYSVPQTAFISVHNQKYEGGGFPFAPKASSSDGYLDVCIVHVHHRLTLIPILLASLLGGNHTLFRNNVRYLRCKSVTVKADRPLTLHTDGEVWLNQVGFSARVLEGAVQWMK